MNTKNQNSLFYENIFNYFLMNTILENVLFYIYTTIKPNL